MPVSIPGTGWPDHEERPMPHSATLDQAAGQTALTTGTVIDNAGDGWHVAAYRSFVVQVMNDDVVPITVTPRWAFWGALNAGYTEDAQTVPAQAHKRLLFQNQADFVQRVLFTGVGANAAFRYYITGSNLDPLPVSAMPICHLAGVAAGVQTATSGVPFKVRFLQSSAFSLISDPTVFTLNTVAAGITDTVTLNTPGIYIATGAFSFDSAAAFNRQGQIDMRTGGPYPRPNSPQWNGFDANEQNVMLADIMPVNPVDAASGAATVSMSGTQTSGGNIVISAAMLRIVRLTPISPY